MGHVLGPLREGAPRQIGPYEVLARLGAGGMGEVFLAREPGGSFVAVKTVRRDLAGDPAFRDRFRREIKVARIVDSGYAAAPVGGDADAEVPWLATAYVPGPSLSQAVRRHGPLPVDTVRALGAGLARALGDLHTAGVLHRDLKPGNVMLDAAGPRVIDFGIARGNGATTMTATGMMVGTPAFMSPEHVAGARRVVGASDVFCLGSLLCYAVTGEDPFGDGPVAAVLYRVSQAEADLSRVPAEDGLRDVLAACLSVEPDLRPTPERLAALLGGERAVTWPAGVQEHIGEYRAELARVAAAGTPLLPVAPAPTPGVHQLPTMPPAPPTAPEPGPRRGRRALLAAVVALAVLGGAGLEYVLMRSEDAKKQPPAQAAPPASGPLVPGVDDRGLADSSGVVPQSASQRPAGWKPWRAKLTAPALGCSAGTAVLVCRTTDGRYEALDTANGKPLWSADLVEDARDNMSFVGPTGAVFLAGGTARPAVHDTAVVLVSGDRLQVRDARTGRVRWEKEAWGSQGLGTRPLVGDGVVFAATRTAGETDSEQVGMTAFSLTDGTPLWTKALTNAVIPNSDKRSFEPVAFARHQVFALSDGGLVAYDAKTGTLRGQVEQDAEACAELKVLGALSYCTDVSYSRDGQERLRVLDSATLASKTDLPASVEKLRPDVVGPNALITFDGGLRFHAPRDGRRLGQYPAKATPAGLEQDWSTPLLAGDQVVYADFSALYTARLGKDGTPAGLRTVPVPGAPGPRAGEGFDPVFGDTFARRVRAPEVLPIGGIAHIVYDKGVVASVELPK